MSDNDIFYLLEDNTLGEGGDIPRYAMLDLWSALSYDPNLFDAFYETHGYADTWAELLYDVRHLVNE